jgi:hypothetical protein
LDGDIGVKLETETDVFWDFTGIGANKAGARTKKRTGIGDDASLFGINNDKSGYSASGLIWKTADKVTNA